MNTPDTATPTRPRWRWLAVLAFVGLMWAVVEFSGLRGQLSAQALREGFAQHRVWGFALFAALFALANLMHIPGGFFLAAAVLALGPLWGALATYVAACIGCTLTFVVVRSLGADALRGLDNRIARRLLARLDAHPARSVLLLRLLFQSMPALNYTLALSGVSLRDYVIGTLLGLPLPIAVITLLFDTLAAWLGSLH
ncbi:TVP38/TMEM64 family protein [Roseateles sp. P5_E7]